MQIVFKNDQLVSPQVSVVLLDWSCRESFHILDYLENQTVPRAAYEVIWIEYYNRKPSQIEQKLRQCEISGKPPVLDQWVLLDMPTDVYYHKHLMYNVGVLLSRGRIVAICDSDAIVRSTFLEGIISSFESNLDIVLHMDEVRNNNRRFYPFSYPSIEDVLGNGCVNWQDGKTVGLRDTADRLHTRNYGACMAALREDLVKIGGADEHIDYLGHICGPYEMTFRLVNSGKRELWHPTEFLYHVWHPGQAGESNYVGPHDGRQVSSRALQGKFTGRVLPLSENPAIQNLRLTGSRIPLEQSLRLALLEERLQTWSAENLVKLKPRLWRTLLSFQRRTIAVRLAMTFLKLLFRRLRTKAAQFMGKGITSSGVGAGSIGLVHPKSSRRLFLNLARANSFLRSTVEFFVFMIQQSRDCLNSMLSQGHPEVSIYGTDEAAEILYDLTFDIPIKLKNVYGDAQSKRFHAFRVLPIETYRANEEPLIIIGSAEIEERVDRIKRLGVSSERLIVVI